MLIINMKCRAGRREIKTKIQDVGRDRKKMKIRTLSKYMRTHKTKQGPRKGDSVRQHKPQSPAAIEFQNRSELIWRSLTKKGRGSRPNYPNLYKVDNNSGRHLEEEQQSQHVPAAPDKILAKGAISPEFIVLCMENISVTSACLRTSILLKNNCRSFI